MVRHGDDRAAETEQINNRTLVPRRCQILVFVLLRKLRLPPLSLQVKLTLNGLFPPDEKGGSLVVKQWYLSTICCVLRIPDSCGA